MPNQDRMFAMNGFRASVFLFLTFLCSLTQGVPAQAQQGTSPLEARVEGNMRYSSDRSIAMTEFWVPLAQNELDGSVLFVNLRMMGDNNENRELNIGVGYREMVNAALLGKGIAGVMLWFDRRATQRGSHFNQVTLGGEWLGESWDIRANAYIPLNKDKHHAQANPNGSGVGFVGNQIIVNTDQSVVEEALIGLDLEFGRKFDFMDGITDSTRVYVGGYHFDGDRTEDVTGYRARIASDITSNVQVGTRFQHDDVRGAQTYLEATIRFPFGNKKSFKQDGLRSRLDESPERDIDIVSNEEVIDSGVNQTLLNANASVTQNVIHVDNTAGGAGDGSVDAPYNTLAAAQAAAVANDLIYVHRGDGMTTGQSSGITLDDDGQMLVGAGANLIYDTGRFKTSNGLNVTDAIVVNTAGLAPVITNGAGSGVDITADGVFVSGITVDNASGRGIYALNNTGLTWSNGVTISDVTAQNNTLDGILVYALNAGSTISKANFTNNTANANGVRGLIALAHLGGTIGQADFTDNTANNNTLHGMYAVALDVGGTINTANFTNNTANSNGVTGLFAEARSGATIGQVDFTGNTANTNVQRGFYALANNGGTLGEANFTDNTAQNNTLTGFIAYSFGAGSTLTEANFTNNIADTNGRQGFWALAQSGGTLSEVNFADNTAQNNTEHGLYAYAVDAGSRLGAANFTNNTANANGQVGFYVFAETDASIFQAVVQSNLATNNGTYGIFIDDDSTAGNITADLGGGVFGSTGGNSVSGSVLQELGVDLDGAELKAEGNWWGAGTGLAPTELLLEDASTADTTPFLTVEPEF